MASILALADRRRRFFTDALMASFFDMWLMASFFGLVRASAKILLPRSHGLNFWTPGSVGEDFFIDGLVAPPSPSVCVCVCVCVCVRDCVCVCVT